MSSPADGPLAGAAPNAEQVEYWNRIAGPKWVALEERLERQLAPLGRRVVDRADLRPGERVLDVGCGCGGSALEAARRLGPEGEVVALDVSTVMLERASRRAGDAGLGQIRFERGDAQVHAFDPEGFDAVISRFGVMFFADFRAAFANLRRALRRRGRLTFVCWQALERNPWMAVPLRAALAHLPPPPPRDPAAPGPFALADGDLLRNILVDAGFADVSLEPASQPLEVGGGGALDEVVDFMLQLGPVGAMLRDAGPDPGLRSRVAGAIRAALAPHATPSGVWMESSAWIASARRA